MYRTIRDTMANDPVLANTLSWNDMERDEQIEDGYKKLNRRMKVSPILTDYKNVSTFSLCQSGGNSTSLHHIMFELTVRYLGDDEQVAKWLPKVLSCQMIGSYSQTELGHGSNVQGLETTATLDKETDSWVIHSPSVSAAKWWPGDLGLIGTHACVFAQTIVDGENHGVNAFMVQIRDLESHRALPGIEVGDIGPKFGFETKDNGYALFNNVRIPRTDILKRYIEVEKSGDVNMLGNPLILYSIMMFTRI